jgi:hypothetical protein
MTGRKTRAQGSPDPVELTAEQLTNRHTLRELRLLNPTGVPPIVVDAEPVATLRPSTPSTSGVVYTTSTSEMAYSAPPADYSQQRPTSSPSPGSISRTHNRGRVPGAQTPSPGGTVHPETRLPSRPASADVRYDNNDSFAAAASRERRLEIRQLLSQQAYLTDQIDKLLRASPSYPTEQSGVREQPPASRLPTDTNQPSSSRQRAVDTNLGLGDHVREPFHVGQSTHAPEILSLDNPQFSTVFPTSRPVLSSTRGPSISLLGRGLPLPTPAQTTAPNVSTAPQQHHFRHHLDQHRRDPFRPCLSRRRRRLLLPAILSQSQQSPISTHALCVVLANTRLTTVQITPRDCQLGRLRRQHCNLQSTTVLAQPLGNRSQCQFTRKVSVLRHMYIDSQMLLP